MTNHSKNAIEDRIASVLAKFPDVEEFICMASKQDWWGIEQYIMNTTFRAIGVPLTDAINVKITITGTASINLGKQTIHFCKWDEDQSYMGPVFKV